MLYKNSRYPLGVSLCFTITFLFCLMESCWCRRGAGVRGLERPGSVQEDLPDPGPPGLRYQHSAFYPSTSKLDRLLRIISWSKLSGFCTDSSDSTFFSWQSYKQCQCHRNLCPTRERPIIARRTNITRFFIPDRKSVLHLLKCMFQVRLSRCSADLR